MQGDIRAVARVCRLVDDAVGEYRDILKDLFALTGQAWTIGITGTPGAGKSTLSDRLITSFREDGVRIGVVAIDPSSPFSGGAILGDRIRMQRHHADPEVFIRSVATRGTLGGLSRSAGDLVRVLDAWGADIVIVETVGVGQDELEVTRTADSTVVVVAPGMGDEVQAIKAGILECADVFAVNKADCDGADAAAHHLELMISIGGAIATARPDTAGHHAPSEENEAQRLSKTRPEREQADSRQLPEEPWVPPIVRCVSTQGRGIDELCSGLEAHRDWLYGTDGGRQRRYQRLQWAMRDHLRNALIDCATEQMGDAIERAVQKVAKRELDPYSAADGLIEKFRTR